MGLFSTRKSDDNPDSHATNPGGNDNPVVRVIRSRLYGRNKGKERESPNMPYAPSDPSPSESLSGPNPHLYSPTLSSPLARSKTSRQSNAPAGPSSPRILGDVEHATPPSRTAKRPYPGSPDMPPSPPPKSPAPASRQREREMEREKDSTPTKSPQLPASSPRKAADAVTVSLAQKLNELAVANSEGLLNDDEYRLLRQNLFERFASTTVVPAENPVVPVAKPRPRANEAASPDSRSVSRPLSSTFQVPRSPSRISLSFGVDSIFRRVSGRRSTSTNKDTSDISSIVSAKSGTSSIFKLTRKVTRKSSISSVNTTASLPPRDSISISSRRAKMSYDQTHAESVTSFSPTRSTAASVKRFPATPPSSYRGAGLENKQLGTYNGLYDDDRLQSSQEIKQEILSVETEAKNMMDAFNGLELTALTKLQKATGRNSVVAHEGTNLESTLTSVSDEQSQHMIVDNDSSSIKSGTSAGTSISMARSAYSARKVHSKKSLTSPVGPGVFLHRQNSSSSFNLSRASNVGLNRPNASLVVMRVVPEGDVDMEADVEEIRRRREEVMMRYEARLEYLRARLKGAQLHEKLLRK